LREPFCFKTLGNLAVLPIYLFIRMRGGEEGKKEKEKEKKKRKRKKDPPKEK
jgi:hypothetical protein